MSLEQRAERLLARAGITINGPEPTDMQVLVEPKRLFRRVFSQGRLGFGEAFMENWWDVEDFAGFVTRVHRANLGHAIKMGPHITHAIQALLSYWQTRTRGHEVAVAHYNFDNDLFERMLDDVLMMYSCGLYRTGARNNEEAEIAKCDLISDKLYFRDLRLGDTVLDIGCGYTAGFLRRMVERFPAVRGVGVANSEEQCNLARERVQELPIDIQLRDYRDIEGKYARVVSIGMLEHVGPGHYPLYFRKLRELLEDDGLAFVHWIGSRTPQWTCDPWHHKYIFPYGVAGSLSQVVKAAEQYFVIEDVDNFGADYDPKLMGWFNKLDANWPELEPRYGSKQGPTFRMMKYYVPGMAGAFRARHMQLYQVVLSPNGVPGGYRPVR